MGSVANGKDRMSNRLKFSQRLTEIGNQTSRIFDANRKPYCCRRDTQKL